MRPKEKLLILAMIILLQACTSSERTKILESNVKNMEVYTSDDQLICKEMPCPVKFNKEEGKSQTVKLKLDGFESEEEISVKIWNFERNLRRTGSVSNVVLYPISIVDAPIIGITVGPLIGFSDSFSNHDDSALLLTTQGSTKGTTAAAITQMRMVNDIWFYDPDHIYIDVKLCNKNNQCVYPQQFGYKGYGYEVTHEATPIPEQYEYPNITDVFKMDTIRRESQQYSHLIKKDEIIIKRFVIHNYAELKAYRWEYMKTLGDLTGLETNKLEKIIDKSTSAPELAETLSHYPKKR